MKNLDMSTQHLQTEEPALSFEEWYLQTCKLFADAWKIDGPMASRKLNIYKLREWYDDGFTPYATFRENFKPLY